jgi:hypothetical protein
MRMVKDGRIFRPGRRNNIINCLKGYLAYVSEYPETEQLKSAKQPLEITIHNLESIFFPGMTGRQRVSGFGHFVCEAPPW